MGCKENITLTKFPKQGGYVGLYTKVCFHYNTTETIFGRIIRDDQEDPWRTLILLEDGRVVDACECQHSPFLEPGHPNFEVEKTAAKAAMKASGLDIVAMAPKFTESEPADPGCLDCGAPTHNGHTHPELSEGFGDTGEDAA